MNTLIIPILMVYCSFSAVKPQEVLRWKRATGNDVLQAISNQNEAEAVRLIEGGTDANIADDLGQLPLHWSAKWGLEKVARALIEKGYINQISSKDSYGDTPLHEAVSHGNENIANLILNHGADINVKNDFGKSALHSAVEKNYESTVRLLVEKGSDVNIKENNGMSPLHIAAKRGFDGIVRLLLEKSETDVNIKDENQWSPLHHAVEKGHIGTIRLLLNHNSDTNIKDSQGWTPLHRAAKHDRRQIARMLIQKQGTDVNVKENSGRTPLHIAAANGFEEFVRLLLQSGTDINSKDNDGWTPLHESASHGHDKIVEVLLANGARINEKNNDGKLPVSIAVEKRHEKIVNLLDAVDSSRHVRKINAACARYSKKQPTNYILMGKTTSSGEFPFMVALGYLNLKITTSRSVSFKCGGTIISERFIITAAHCTREDEPPIIVRLGTNDLKNRTVHDLYIQNIIRHERYSNELKKNDIALIRLRNTITFTTDIRPACLETDLNDLDPNIRLTVIGYGSESLERISSSNRLLKTEVVTMPLSQCDTIYSNFNQAAQNKALEKGITPNQYCAFDPMGRSDTCAGDSGGPLLVYRNPYTAHVVGIVSFGIGCNTSFPGIYTRVAYYSDWIASHVWRDAF